MVSRRVSASATASPSKLLDQNVRFSSITATEDRSCGLVKETDLVLFLPAVSKISPISVVNQREDTTADRNARCARVASFPPGGAEGANLCGLLDVERLAGLIEFEG